MKRHCAGLQARDAGAATCIKVRAGFSVAPVTGTEAGTTGTIAETGEAIAGCAVFRQ